MRTKFEKSLRPYAIIPTPIVCDREMRGSDLRVYAVISSHAQADGRAWPSLQRIADFIGVDRANVSRSIRRLVNKGYILKLSVGGGRKNATVYRVKREPSANPGKGVTGDTLKDPRRSNFFVKNGVTGDNETVSQVTPKYNMNIISTPLTPLQRGDMGGADAPALDCAVVADATSKGGPDGPTQSVAVADATVGLAGGVSAAGKPCKNSHSQDWANEKIALWINRTDPKNNGWPIIDAASDPDHEDHLQSLKCCLAVAKALSIGWHPPKKKKMAS